MLGEDVKKLVKSLGRRYMIGESTYTEKQLEKIPEQLRPFYREVKELRTGFCRFEPIESFYEETDRNKRRWLHIGTTEKAEIYFNLEPAEIEQENGYTIAILENAGRRYKNKAKWHDPVELLKYLAENGSKVDSEYCLLDRDEWIHREAQKAEKEMREEGIYPIW